MDVFMLLLVWGLLVGPVLAQVRHPLPVLWMMPVSSEGGGAIIKDERPF